MKKILLILAVFISLLFLPTQVLAQRTENGCTAVGQCVLNKRCILQPVPGAPSGTTVLTPQGADCGAAQLGGVALPNYVSFYPGSNGSTGLITFISRLINLFVIICGMWSMFNFLFAGYTLISSQSDAKAMSTIRESLTMTAIGIAIIAGSYMLAGLIGLIFFGDASFLITPKITGAIDLN